MVYIYLSLWVCLKTVAESACADVSCKHRKFRQGEWHIESSERGEYSSLYKSKESVCVCVCVCVCVFLKYLCGSGSD